MNQVNPVNESESASAFQFESASTTAAPSHVPRPIFGDDEDKGPIKVSPVLITCVGSTSAEIGVNVMLKNRAAGKRVPYRVAFIDSVPYEALVDRLKTMGFTKREINEAIPRSRYFELTDPIQGALDIDADINAHWRRILFEDALLQQATRTSRAPGSNGIPALGRLRVEGNAGVAKFLGTQISELTQINDTTLALQPGVRAMVITTCRGGTGTGAAAYVGVALGDAMNGRGERHLMALMPDIFGEEADNRMRSNAYALLQLLQSSHATKGRLPLLDGSRAEGPFDSVFPVFGSDGARALNPGNAVAFVTSLLCAQLRPRLQASLAARRINLNDAMGNDPDGNPNHIEGHVAVSVNVAPEGSLRFIALEWLRLELAGHGRAFEKYIEGEPVGEEEDREATGLLEVAGKQHGAFAAERLFAALDGTANPLNNLSATLEGARRKVPGLLAGAIKTGMPVLLGDVSGQFEGFARNWQKQMPAIARSLPAEIASVTAKYGADRAAVQVETLRRARELLKEIAVQAEAAFAKEGDERSKANALLDQRLTELQSATGILLIFRKDEIVRDAALEALKPLGKAAEARLKQERCAALARLLTGQLGDDGGKPLANVVETLQGIADARVPELRQWFIRMLGAIGIQQSAVRRVVDSRSVFDRSLFYDKAGSAELAAVAASQRAQFVRPAPIVALLRGECSLEQAVEGLEKLLPTYNIAARPLLEVLRDDPAQLDTITTLVREIRPFLPVDDVVAREQGLDGRRDTVAILELPGGKTSWLGAHFRQEAAIGKLDEQIVESDDQTLRYYLARVSLPYYALHSIKAYRKAHDVHLRSVGSVTPYSVPNGPSLPHIVAPRDTMQIRCELQLAEGLLSGLVTVNPLIRTLHVDHVDYDGNAAGPFPTAEAAVAWLGREPQARRALLAAATDLREHNPTLYVSRLREHAESAPEPLRARLRSLARKLGVDLRPPPNPTLVPPITTIQAAE